MIIEWNSCILFRVDKFLYLFNDFKIERDREIEIERCEVKIIICFLQQACFVLFCCWMENTISCGLRSFVFVFFLSFVWLFGGFFLRDWIHSWRC